ncbi:hypothetical protein [Zavarzinella formosa]|uniref:hypothetical protein n=1 Tax=Zavarzinella formosa TaxID=360055 RepID=UPI0002FBCAF4|nr:hypothetical protein [Zavarzinella formosa]
MFQPSRTILLLAAIMPVNSRAEDVDRPPVRYSAAPENNAVSRLADEVRAGRKTLEHHPEHGYLPAVLKELGVPVSSQTLVFSKTSLQRSRISPKTPRAIYFSDDVTVGFCQRGDVVELTATDTDLGVVFYTLDQNPNRKARFTRQTDQCLICHSSSMNHGFPGHLLRSVTPDHRGEMALNFGTKRIDYTSPMEDRWGGWYVTGTAPKLAHRGNKTINGRDDEEPKPRPQDVTELKEFFTVADYLSPHSDIVALLVLEHQTEIQNRIARANYLVRFALREQAEMNEIFKEPAATRSDGITRRINDACENVVRGLLFAEEAKIEGPVAGTSTFAKDYTAAGPFDGKKRSLREFDLKTRLFRYPCSAAIYSPQLAALPPDAKARVYQRLREILTGKDQSKEYAHLSATDRAAIREILLDTHPALPDDWKK